MNYSKGEKLFSHTPTVDFFNTNYQSIVNKILSLSESDILNLGIEAFTLHLVQNNEIELPIIDESNITLSSYDALIPTNWFPSDFSFIDPGKPIKKSIVVFHLPYIGDLNFLRLRPSSFSTANVPYTKQGLTDIQFEYINFYNNQEMIRNSFNEDLRLFIKNYNWLKVEFSNFNSSLRDFIIREIEKRKSVILQKRSFLNSFGIPLKSNENTPKTFSIPSPRVREKIKISKPVATNNNFKPEPSLDENNYHKILKIIDDVGRNFERMPSVYKDKGEEDLRDHILMVLDPNFELGSAAGETFNKSGKTDISLRYESSVVFIAECKFWNGEMGFLKTIDQLLSYLTWRDSKTCIVIFVKHKEIITILEKVKKRVVTHNCYVAFRGEKSQNWLEYVFRLPNDINKELLLTILLFHLPTKL